MNAQEFRATFGVSRETTARLECHLGLLERWSARINLVSRGTLADAWRRHAADSAQLFDLVPPGVRSWIDLGSGAGFPGLVVAAIAHEKAPGLAVTLVESDRRKAAFLRTAARSMGLEVEILARRAEELPARRYDVVSARALAPLPALLPLARRFAGPETVLLFPKGRNVERELTEALERWHTRVERLPSRTDPEATILRIRELATRP